MVPFVEGGPDIPLEVEQALAENRLVFFCGAGISEYMDLPLFEGLVNDVCKKLNISVDDHAPLKRASDQKRYDRILGLLEGGRSDEKTTRYKIIPGLVRREIIKILESYDGCGDDEIAIKEKVVTHKALLDLSRLPDGGHRLVTTNFDCLFFKAGLDANKTQRAPMLGAPREDTWREATFLHGVIDQDNDPAGNKLVLTETDFGRAYLFNRWASDFIIELFREFTVLMVGYSADDPVMGYLMMTLGAERDRGAGFRETYALVGCDEDTQVSVEEEWISKKIIPISYRKKDKHKALHETLRLWANLKTGGFVEQKNKLQRAVGTPYESDSDTDLKISREITESMMLDNKLLDVFVNLDTTPDISWMHALTNYENKIDKRRKKDECPALLGISELAGTPDVALSASELSGSARKIREWLSKNHLDKKELIHWVIDQGGIPHPEFRDRIRWNLPDYSGERALAPRMRSFWEIASSENHAHDHTPLNSWMMPPEIKILHDLDGSINHTAKEFWLRQFRPRIVFKNQGLIGQSLGESDNFFEAKLELSINDNITELIKPLQDEESKREILSACAEDFTHLLKLAMEKAASVDLVAHNRNRLYGQYSFVSERAQNERLESWMHLVNMVRDSFDAAIQRKNKVACMLFRMWQIYPYPLFYRLSLYAVTEHHELPDSTVIKLLENEEKQVLWSFLTEVEVLRYLKERPHTAETTIQLTRLILKGPPRNMYIESLPNDKFLFYKEQDIFVRLENLSQSGIDFPENAKDELRSLREKHGEQSKLKPAVHQATWEGLPRRLQTMSDDEIRIELLKAPGQFPPDKEFFPDGVDSEFRDFAMTQPKRVIQILDTISRKDFKKRPWILRAALSGIRYIDDHNKPSRKRRRFLCMVVQHMGMEEDLISKCRYPLADNMQKDAVALSRIAPDRYFDLWRKLLKICRQDVCEDVVNMESAPLNSASGKLGQALMDVLWSRYRGEDSRDTKIPNDLKPLFDDLAMGGEDAAPAALYHLGGGVNLLYYVDPHWTSKKLLPLMKWNDPSVAYAIWSGFLLRPDYTSKLFPKIKPMFLDSFKNLTGDGVDAGYAREKLSGMLFNACCTPPKSLLSENESRNVMHYLDTEQLWRIAWCMGRTLDGAGDRAGVLWEKRLGPWFEKHWPRQIDKQRLTISRQLVDVTFASREKFPEALEVVIDFMNPENDRDTPRGRLSSYLHELANDKNGKFEIIFGHPSTLLELMDKTITAENITYYKKDLRKVLDRIRREDESWASDSRYQKLERYT